MEETYNELKERIDQLENWKKSARKSFFQDKIELLQKIKTNLGDTVDDIVDSHVREDNLGFWQNISKNISTPDVGALVQKLWVEMCAPGGIEFDMTTRGEITQMHVTKCPFADMARELGLEKWGYQFYCMSDYAIVEGFNPKIEFTRTKTLMQGHDCCDHTYQLQKNNV
ncbi:L-2-amino-thiazoline-4-carboxylic acid hydrolase [Candidatus Lokiarchaeum ossiferum]|uniref:L-2-amino-thiazoline-4-carboxylic acid hydrolase n=1 Tax=Candidatus Lokiarchaeum ossiferum TaxID=2951803 RepID=UPI00352D9FDE